MKPKHIIEENSNIVLNCPLYPGDTVSHAGADACVGLGLAVREDGNFVPTRAGRLLHEFAERTKHLDKRLAELEGQERRVDPHLWMRSLEERYASLAAELHLACDVARVNEERAEKAEAEAQRYQARTKELERRLEVIRDATRGVDEMAEFIERMDEVPEVRRG